MAIAVAALVAAFLISYCLTPLVRLLAIRVGFVDRPDGQRKIQTDAVSLGGGIALLLTTPLVVFLVASWWGPDLWWMARRPGSIIGLAMAAAVLGVVGIIDDSRGMKGSYKLLWQVIAALIISGTGFKIAALQLFGYRIPLSFLGNVFTVLWLLGAINSLNLIDGVDGLAGTVGTIFSLTLGCMALLTDQYLDAMIAFSLAGSMLGFLRFNYPPATIYLGDTGSMFIGLMLGTIALRCSMKQAAGLAFSVPLAIWTIPMFDSFAALLRRRLTGRSIYATDRGHIHHVLLTRGLNAAQAVRLIAGLCMLTSVGAVASLYYENEWLGIISVAFVLGLLIFTKVFGHRELSLVNARLHGFGRMIAGQGAQIRETSVNLQGTRRWEEMWGALVDSAERFRVVKMRLNLSMPRLHEDFYATWQKSGSNRRELLWQADIPLVVDDMPVGRLCVTGVQDAQSASAEMRLFIDFVEGLEARLHSLIQAEMSRLREPPAPATAPEDVPSPLEDEVGSSADGIYPT
ncbi:MAG: undecaprenyl/decaprenyl-phosphate alpha-N-acetylglucosaminyl 1-phosphate transferase [Planctomycetales bacterium]|nr:undecaprenyl/decaprenyl-phosphate alpha-N-acetylglucosaminyl 1-phosphate transferase [Planctomycetales bacterium]MCA9167115.1 undecaprenyl/decaprenyl-phosphate alpha-N-acetylglucosaminyl 1-phosphate transferase [Planctomycetales bacterium]